MLSEWDYDYSVNFTVKKTGLDFLHVLETKVVSPRENALNDTSYFVEVEAGVRLRPRWGLA